MWFLFCFVKQGKDEVAIEGKGRAGKVRVEEVTERGCLSRAKGWL